MSDVSSFILSLQGAALLGLLWALKAAFDGRLKDQKMKPRRVPARRNTDMRGVTGMRPKAGWR
jgi:hypothetical protein